jgi:hypothetical protein
MSLRNLPKFIQLRSISKSRLSGINTNLDITPPNNIGAGLGHGAGPGRRVFFPGSISVHGGGATRGLGDPVSIGHCVVMLPEDGSRA